MLNKELIEMLIDLVEIKLSYFEIQDREDVKELKKLKSCSKELKSILRSSRNEEVEQMIDEIQSK